MTTNGLADAKETDARMIKSEIKDFIPRTIADRYRRVRSRRPVVTWSCGPEMALATALTVSTIPPDELIARFRIGHRFDSVVGY